MKRLLLVFAHPDDESFSCGGTVAKYVKAGWNVDLICATRGEDGSRGPYIDLPQDQLGDIRQKELQKAGITLGINSITFLGYRDGTLSSQTPGTLEDNVYKKMEEFVPDAVITMDTTGISNHPDHIKMCFVTTYAFQKYAAWIKEKLKDQQVAAQIFPKLYYACMPESLCVYLKKKKPLSSESFGKPWRGTPDKYVTTVINIMKFASTKKKALTSHISQQEDINRFLSMPSQPLLKHEYFILRMYGTTEVFMGKHDRVSNAL
ncbi:MAG: PIG-L family deacetylase [Candidatus Gottesmanbacteria bacterium]|nr:PIG-L family deacetylase [Candidatus Gottesmanbacteria bacterium]